MSTYLLDANVVLRFLTQDHPARAKAATALFAKAKNKQAVLEFGAAGFDVEVLLQTTMKHGGALMPLFCQRLNVFS